LAIQHEYDDEKKHIHVLSYGGGTQSTALLLMALKGEINGVIPDYIIFADTGWEPEGIYNWIEKVNAHIKTHFNREILIAKGRNIRHDIIHADTGRTKKFITIPAYVKNPANGKIGMNRRQCTTDYKITPIKKKIRELLGYAPRKWVKETVHIWKGISTDEIHRVKPSQERWQIAEHPLIDVVELDRQQCIKYVEDEGLGTPAKSSCIGCPYHDDRAWIDMRENDPKSWEDAIFVDKQLRINESPLKGEVFLHQSGLPLDEVVLKYAGMESDAFTNECEGMCGI
jgi:hypothetical protein